MLETSINEFCLQVRVIRQVQRGNTNWEPVSLSSLRKVVNVKQHKLPGKHMEIKPIQELNSWWMTINHPELNKIFALIHVAVLYTATILDSLSMP